MNKQFNFSGVLSRDEMKQVNGGMMEPGTCGYSGGGGGCGVSKAQALAAQAQYGGYWCCDSCINTSYCGPLDWD